MKKLDLTEEQIKYIDFIFDQLITKCSIHATMQTAESGAWWYSWGMVDGINNCWKFLHNEEGDYLDGINTDDSR